MKKINLNQKVTFKVKEKTITAFCVASNNQGESLVITKEEIGSWVPEVGWLGELEGTIKGNGWKWGSEDQLEKIIYKNFFNQNVNCFSYKVEKDQLINQQ